jgi:hypothetical protein
MEHFFCLNTKEYVGTVNVSMKNFNCKIKKIIAFNNINQELYIPTNYKIMLIITKNYVNENRM